MDVGRPFLKHLISLAQVHAGNEGLIGDRLFQMFQAHSILVSGGWDNELAGNLTSMGNGNAL